MPITNKQFKLTLIFITIQLISAAVFMLIMNQYINNENIFIFNLSFYIFIFVIPVLIFIYKVFCINPFDYLNLTKNSLNGILKGLLISMFITLIYLIMNGFKIDITSTNFYILIGSALAGLFEEIPFRGFYLRAFNEQSGFWKANLITSFLFAIIHLESVLQGDVIQILMLFIIGIWLGYIHEKTKSLWSPIIVHMVYNIINVLL